MTFIVSADLVGVLLFCLLGVWTQNLSFLGARSAQETLSWHSLMWHFQWKHFDPLLWLEAATSAATVFVFVNAIFFFLCRLDFVAYHLQQWKKKKKRRPVTEVQEILIYLRVPHVCFCLSHSFLYTAVSRIAVNLRGCCGWFFEDKLCLCVFFLFFFFICSGWLWWVSVKDSLCCPP